MTFTTPLPEGIYHEDKFYAMNTDFKTWLKIDELIQSDLTEETKKIALIIALAYKNALPESIDAALTGVLDFYSGYNLSKGNNEKKLYSFEKDAPFIFSAFYSQYNIDLFEVNLHWWKFKALFNSLEENTLFGKIIRYRAINLEDVKDKERKKFIRKMKQLYSLGEQENIADAVFAL